MGPASLSEKLNNLCVFFNYLRLVTTADRDNVFAAFQQRCEVKDGNLHIP